MTLSQLEVQQMMTLQVAEKSTEARDIVSLILRDPHGGELPAWSPGDHIDLKMSTPDGLSLVRQYSLCGDPSDQFAYRIAILQEQESSGASEFIHTRMRQGQIVQVSHPKSRFPFVLHQRLTFVAGGIGITPLLPMLKEAQSSGVSWELHYAGKSLETMAFVDQLEDHENVKLYPSSQEIRLSVPNIVEGAKKSVIYACGPSRLLDDLEVECESAQVELVVERFTNDNQISSSDDHEFEVELTLSEVTLPVPPGTSILDAVSNEGIPVPSSCRGGTCGTCETFVIDGQPDHRDAVLTAQEREESEVMMICVSRCKGNKLVLEI